MRKGHRATTVALTATLLALMLLAFWLRLINIDAFSFWTDEGLTPLRSGYSVAEILSNRVIIQDGITNDTHPPLYYLMIHFTRQLFGETDFGFRFPSVLAGVLLVPMLYQFGRRLGGRGVGLISAVIVAINPLQIYYANEARMYTLVVLLGAAASYVLWRALSGVRVRRMLLLYVLLAALMLYTHYTAVFLIGVQSLFWVWILWQNGYKKLILALGGVALLAAIPLVPFTVPRLFTGAEANYYYVSPLIMLQDVVHFFSQGMTANLSQWWVKLINVGVVAIAGVGLWAARPWLKRSFLLTYLLAVVVGLMAGSLIKPMYQGVRHIMLGSPALLLLLAFGLNQCLLWARTAEKPKRALAWGISAVALLILLLGPLLSLNNLYNNPHYAKDDFRSMIAAIEQQAGANDLIIYNNAILLPLHDHYQQREDVAVTAVPIYPHKADNVANRLAPLAQQYDRIWFVTDPPADGRDDDERVQTWLDESLMRLDEQSFHARTVVVSAVSYATRPGHIASLPDASQPLDVAWDTFPTLMGIELLAAEPAVGPSLWLDLFWQGATPAPEGASLRLDLKDATGNTWASGQEIVSVEPDAWPSDGLVRQPYRMAIEPGMPPGRYTIEAQPFGINKEALGEPVALMQVTLAAEEQPFKAQGLLFDNGLSLQAIQPYDTDVRPGHTLPVALFWQMAPDADIDPATLTYEVEVIAPSGEVVRTQSGQPGGEIESWPTTALIRENTGLYFPPESEPGTYQLRWTLRQGEEPIGVRPAWRPWSSEQATYEEITVTPWPMVTTPPEEMDVALSAEFGNAITLVGYDLTPPTDGNELALTLHWLASGSPEAFYVVFVHVVDDAGNIVAQSDRLPLDGLRPTTGWREGEYLSDPISIFLPSDIASGSYHVNVGLYAPDQEVRPPVFVEGEMLPNNQLPLTTIEVP